VSPRSNLQVVLMGLFSPRIAEDSGPVCGLTGATNFVTLPRQPDPNMTNATPHKVSILAEALRQTGELLLRHRVIPIAVGLSFFAVVTAFGTVDEQISEHASIPVQQEVLVRVASLGSGASAQESIAREGGARESEGMRAANFRFEERFARGDTIAAMLARLFVSAQDANRMLADRQASQVLAKLRPGTSVVAEVSDSGELVSLRFVAGKDRLYSIERGADGFRTSDEPALLQSQIHARAGVIGSSFFAAADAIGVPDGIATRIAEVFGTEIDFHRDFRRGDRFTVVFETLHHEGRLIRSGRLLAGEVVRGGRTHRAAWFEHGDVHGYFTPSGHGMTNAFVRSPLEFTRITSGFETRYMPGSRRWETHKGIDYAAPAGTPVRATGDGVVQFAGAQGGYGNVVILKHKGDITTLYAHLSAIAPDVRPGARVGQMDLIGYVGQTGWATGPHLHYEYQVGGQHVDPLTVSLASSNSVPARLLPRFRETVAPLTARLDLLRETTLASAE